MLRVKEMLRSGKVMVVSGEKTYLHYEGRSIAMTGNVTNEAKEEISGADAALWAALAATSLIMASAENAKPNFKIWRELVVSRGWLSMTEASQENFEHQLKLSADMLYLFGQDVLLELVRGVVQGWNKDFRNEP